MLDKDADLYSAEAQPPQFARQMDFNEQQLRRMQLNDQDVAFTNGHEGKWSLESCLWLVSCQRSELNEAPTTAEITKDTAGFAGLGIVAGSTQIAFFQERLTRAWGINDSLFISGISYGRTTPQTSPMYQQRVQHDGKAKTKKAL